MVFLGLELERGVQIFCTSVLSGQLLGSIEVSMLLYTREIKRFHVCFLTADMLLHRRVPIIKFRRLVKFIRPAFNIGCVVNLSNKGFILFRNILWYTLSGMNFIILYYNIGYIPLPLTFNWRAPCNNMLSRQNMFRQILLQRLIWLKIHVKKYVLLHNQFNNKYFIFGHLPIAIWITNLKHSMPLFSEH